MWESNPTLRHDFRPRLPRRLSPFEAQAGAKGETMKKSASVLVALALTCGCATSYRAPRWIRIGMAPQEVSQRMGEPEKRVSTPTGDVWIYRGGRRALIFDRNDKLHWLQ